MPYLILPRGTQEFEEALCVMVELAAKPYVRQKANQELYQDGQAALDALVSSIRTWHTGRDSLVIHGSRRSI